MDRFDNLEVEGVEKGQSLAYDPCTQTHIFAGRGFLFAPRGGPKQSFPSESKLLGPEEAKKIQPENNKGKEHCPPESLRFVPNQKSQQLLISPSGLMVLSKQSSKSNENPIVYTNYGFSSGVHYWEIICPLSCTGLKLGVVKMENKKLTTEEMNVFRTTTGRVVGMLLDFEHKTLQFWLNGKEQSGRAKNLTEGYWLPAIRISGVDNCVILNPYGQHAGLRVPYSCYNAAGSTEMLRKDLEQTLESWVLVSQLKVGVPAAPGLTYLKSQVPTEANIIDVIVPEDEAHNGQGQAFVCVSEVDKFVKDCEAAVPKPGIMAATEMAKTLLASEKAPLTDALVRCIRLREELARARLKDAMSGPEQNAKVELKLKDVVKTDGPYEELVRACEYLPYSDKLLLLGKSSIKLVAREDDEKVGFAAKAGSAAALRMGFAPRSAREKIRLHMNRLEAQQLVIKLNWTDIFESNPGPTVDYVLYFVVALGRAMEASKTEDLFVELPYLTAKRAVDSMLGNLLQALSASESEASVKDAVAKSTAFPTIPLLANPSKPEDKQKHLTIEDINLLLSVLLKADEQLWCLTSTDDVGDDVRALWDVRTSRVHTAYGRLSSFVTWPTPSSITLAEAGLCNVGDKRVSLRHFMEPDTEVENALEYDQKTRGEIWTLLERDFPNNRMLRGEPCANVPLSVTLRYLPSLKHTNTEAEPQEIVHVEQKADSQFVMTASADGSVNVWNTRLRLFRVLATNFKVQLDGKAKPVNVKVEDQENGILTSLFDEEPVQTNGNAEAIQLPAEEKPKVEEKKPEEVKKVVVPKQELLDQIVAMGFPLEMAKKALIAVNNESLEHAMDALLELQKKEPPRTEEKKVETECVIMSWACPKCTLINVEGKKTCEVCNEAAPPTAFKYTVAGAKASPEEKKPAPASPEKDSERALRAEEEKKAKEAEERAIQEQRKLIESATVCGYAMVVHNEYPATPFTVMCALSHAKGSILRIRRFRYLKRYLQAFVAQNSKDPAGNKGSTSQITDLWINSTNDNEIKQHLFGECRDIVETYSPLFVRNQHRDGWTLDKTKLAGSNIVPRDELDLPIHCEKVLDVCSITKPGEKEDAHFAFVLGKKSTGDKAALVLFKVLLSSAFGEDSKLFAKVVAELQLAPAESAKLLCDNEGVVVVVTKESSAIIDTDKLETRNILYEPSDITNVHMLAEGEERLSSAEINRMANSTTMTLSRVKKARRYALAYVTNGLVKRLWLTPKEPASEKAEKSVENTIPQAPKADFPEIVFAYLGIEDLLAYESQMKAIRIGSRAQAAAGTLLSSTKKDVDSDTCSKHNWVICDPSKTAYEFVLSPHKKTTLNHLAVSLTFTQERPGDKPADGSAISAGEKEESKEAGSEEVLAKGLGLLSVHGGGDATTEDKKYHIPLVVTSYKGAQYNFQNHVTRILADNALVFASNYPRPQFVMSHQFGKRMFIDRYVVRAEMGSICGGQPIGAGLVFISDTLSAFERANDYSNITSMEMYKKWIEQRKLSPKPLQSYEPAGFFEMGSATSVTCDLDSKRPGYYVMMKPTAFRMVGGKQVADFTAYPLEIQYFGVIGRVLEEELLDVAGVEYTKKMQEAAFATPYKMQVFISNDGKEWIPATNKFESITVGELKTCQSPSNADVREYMLGIAKLPLPVNRYGGLFKAAVIDSRLQTMPATSYKIVLTKEAGEEKTWSLTAVNAEAFVACDSEMTSKTMKGLPTSYLRSCMGDVTFFGKINKAIVELATKGDINPNVRITACQLLHKIIKTYPQQVTTIAKCIALDDFIHLNIYQQDKASVATAVDLLQQLSAVPEFCKQVYHIILQDIAVIPSFKLSPAGFEAFFEMLRWSMPIAESDAIMKLLNTLHKMSVKYVEPLQRPEVTFLRTRFDDDSYPFDPWTFYMPVDEEDQKSASTSSAAFSGQKQRLPLQSKTLLTWNPALDEFTIDLQKKCLIKELRLIFGKHENTQYKFKLSVYGMLDVSKTGMKQVLAPKRVLLHQKVYEDHTWVQLTDFAHKPSPAFDPTEELEALEVGQLNFVGRYLLVQLQYIKCFKTFTEEEGLVPDITIIPEAYGKELEPCPPIQSLEEAFKAAEGDNEKKVENLKAAHSMPTERLEILKKDVILYRNFVDGGEDTKPEKPQKEEGKGPVEGEHKPVCNELKQLQVDLAVAALDHAKGQKDRKAEIENLIKAIKKGQKRAFMAKGRNQVSEPSLQYFVAICHEYAKIIHATMKDKPGRVHLKLDVSLPVLAKTLFKVFVVNEKGPQREEVLKLLKDVIIPRLDDNEWIWFIFDSISQFLATPCPYYSQKLVIHALDFLSIPDGEILSFLVSKLQVPELLMSIKQLVPDKEVPKAGNEEVSKFSLMSSVLLLALNSLKKISLPEGEDVHKGVVCNCCNNQRWIVGPRYKCGHCPNFNVCGQEKCLEQHLAEFPDHAFIVIPQPLPYSPSMKDLVNIQVRVLLPPFTYVSTTKVHEEIDCDLCGKKSIPDIRYCCGNCDDYNLCAECFAKDRTKHNPNHVFIRLTKPIVTSSTSTPKALIQFLDPLLYALPAPKTKDEHLVPLDGKRSYSLTASLAAGRSISFERLNYDQNMMVAYSVCKWICTASQFPADQKRVLLKLAIELFVCLTKLASLQTLKDLLEDSGSFVQFVMQVLHINDPTITAYITEIVGALKSPPGAKQLPAEQVQKMKPRNRVEYMEAQQLSLHIKVILCSHIQTMLKTLVEIAHNQTLIETSPLYSIYWSQQVWNEHLSYLLELFLGVAEKANVQKKELKTEPKPEHGLLPQPVMMRSISLSSESAHKMNMAEARLQESTTLSIHITKSLVNLLSPHSSRLKVVHHIANLWTLVLKALTMIPLTTVVETKLFDTLVHSFLQSPEEVQQTTYGEILKMTQKIVKEPSTMEDTCRFLLNFLFATLDSAVDTSNEVIAYNVCSGWLDILISKETPKPDDYVGDIYVRLNEEEMVLLIRKGVEMLTKYLSVGTAEGIVVSQNKIVMRIEILADIFRLIASAKHPKGQLAVVAVFKNFKAYEKELEATIPDLINWLLLNEKESPNNTPASEMLAKISGYIQEIIQHLNESEELVRLGLRTLIEFVQEFDKKIYQLSEASSISFSVATKLNTRVNKLMLRFIESWISSDSLALCFALDLKGFEFLLDRIGAADIRSQRLSQIQEDKRAKAPAQAATQPRFYIETDLEDAIWSQLASAGKDMAKEEEYSVNLSKKYEPTTHALEEFAKNMLIESTSASDVLTSYQTVDWSVNKKGYRHKVFNKQLSGALKNEFVMTFKLKTVVEVSELQVGIVNYWGGTNELFIEPSSIVVEGGMNLNNMNIICTLNKVRDDGFANFAVSVFGRNMETYTQEHVKSVQSLINLKMDSLPHFCAKYLRFKFRKGIIACADNSPMIALMKKPKFFALNYISVMGYDVSNLGNYCAYIVDTQKETALQVLSQFCSGEYVKTLQVLATQQAILDKIRTSFEMLVALINTKERLIEPTLVSISSLNKEMGEWIFDKFLDPGRTKKQIVLLFDIVLSSLPELPRRLHKFKDFLFLELAKFKDVSETLGDKMKYLLNFLKTYTKTVRLSSAIIKEPVTIKQNIEEIMLVFNILVKCKEPQVQKKLLRFLLLALYPPALYQNDSVNPSEFFRKNLLTEKLDPVRLMVASYIVSTDQQCAKSLLESGLYKKELYEGIKDDPVAGVPLAGFLQFWLNCCAQSIVREEFARNRTAFVLYESLKQPSATQILKPISEEALTLAVELIKLLTSGKPEQEREMAKMIIKDLDLLASKRDLDFINKVLVPILRMEQTVPICLSPYDSDTKRCLVVSKKKPAPTTAATQHTLFMNTMLLNIKQKNTLLKAFKQQLGASGTYKKVANAKWTKVYSDTSTESSKFAKFWEAAQNQGPALILVTGTCNGKPCTFGAYTGQTIPAMPATLEADYSVNLGSSDDSFFLLYEGDTCRHFKNTSNTEPFATFCVDYDLGGAIVFSNDLFWISWSCDYAMQFGDASSVECIDEPGYKHPEGSFVLTNIEVWSGKVSKAHPSAASPEEAKKGAETGKLSPEKHPWHNSQYPFNIFRVNPVYNVPVGVKADQLSLAVLEQRSKLIAAYKRKELSNEVDIAGLYADLIENFPRANGVLDVEYDIHEMTENDVRAREKAEGEDGDAEKIGYLPKMGVFERFEELGGVKELISVTHKSLKLWKNTDAAAKWALWLQELESFSSIPLFFRLFIKNKKCKDLLFKILAGVPDKEVSTENKKKDEELKRWEEEHQAAVRVSYQNLAEVFRISNDSKMREQAFDNGLIDRILERIGTLTGEKGRKWEDKTDEEEEKVAKKPTEVKEEQKNIDKKKRKGVGYTTNVGEVWKVQEYFESKKSKNEQIKIMVDILASFISAKDWKPSKDLLELFAKSPLLMLVENAFRSGSLLEMSKESSIYFSYFDLVKAFSSQRKLVPLLLELDPHYKPTQVEPIYVLLKKLDGLSNIFVTCLKKEATEESKVPAQLASEIQGVYKFIMGAIEEEQKRRFKRGFFRDALSLPFAERYKLLMRDLRFDYMDMKDASSKAYVHHYASTASGKTNPPATKMVRLAQELADLSNSLPFEHTNAIFVRVDKERVDMMKAIIMGAGDTPYAHGAFEYDLYLDNNYPNEPPKMNLTTTGSGAIRFNPNLYNCGKVCLSLLGTWRGQATENWDPRVSTILQLLMSTQAIIMSEEVYFNEPGFEGEQGTPEGERKNEAYSNVVRLGNIKYAMVGQIRNPPKGFETVVRRHFYLKKDAILKEVKGWVELADKNEASYAGIVYDHNYNWCKMFKENKGKYKEMLVEAIKELEDELNKLPPPSGEDIEKMKEGPKEEAQKAIEITEGVASLEGIDVADDTEVKAPRELNIEDESVKDRWSRYIGAMGVEAVARQAASSILLVGLDALGIEIAKNLVLAGCKRFTVQDSKAVSSLDLAGQFFLAPEEVGQNRAKACVARLQQLNYYVKVDMITEAFPGTAKGVEEMLLPQKYTLIVVADADRKTCLALADFARTHKVKFVMTEAKGLCCRVFTDLTESFEVLDKDGEEPVEVMIQSITTANPGVIKTLGSQRHRLETNDEIFLTEVEGMTIKGGSKSINGTRHKVTVIDPFTFSIGDTTIYGPYVRNGIAKQIKLPKTLKFNSLRQTLEASSLPFDPSLSMIDFAKAEDMPAVHIGFEALQDFALNNGGKLPLPWNIDEAQKVWGHAKELAGKYKLAADEKLEMFVKKFAMTAQGVFAPLCAFLGGIVAQEAIKAVTQKFTPISQLFCYHVMELAPAIKKEQMAELEKHKAVLGLDVHSHKDRYEGLRICIGNGLASKVQESEVFMVGCGAIGCELLKNFAMIGLGIADPAKNPAHKKKGRIIITDPDVIETSNLNRQFLFREKHLRKPKSSTAAAAVISMNKDMKDHILARLDKVHDGTAHIFTDKFFTGLTLVANALDNVQARRYIDMRCVTNKTPLIESGTLGSKGHVQVVIPFKTESYSSQNDPEDNLNIPICTLKMFPEEAIHCVEWARDKFGKLFTQLPKNLMMVLDKTSPVPCSTQEITALKEAIRMLKKRPFNFEDCIAFARRKFQKYFVNDIRQLIYTYPLDFKTKDGTPFWTLPKRPPTELKFNPTDPTHASFVTAIACLKARTWGIKEPDNARVEASALKIADAASRVAVPDFIPSAKKAQAISEEVTKEAGKEEEKKEEEPKYDPNDINALMAEWKELAGKLPQKKGIAPIEFEKDEDANQHVDFLHAIANLRARSYKLEEMSWINVKLKAGRIIPALATTTACVAGLQSIELIKMIQKADVTLHRNAFLNLALPSCSLSEPGPAATIELRPGLKVNLWDRWDVHSKNGKDITLKNVLDYLQETYKLFPRDVMKGAKPVYLYAIMSNPEKKTESDGILGKKLFELLQLQEGEEYVDLNVTFVNDPAGKILAGAPPVRVYFAAQ